MKHPLIPIQKFMLQQMSTRKNSHETEHVDINMGCYFYSPFLSRSHQHYSALLIPPLANNFFLIPPRSGMLKICDRIFRI